MKKEKVFDVLIFADYLEIRYKEEYGENISILKMNKALYFCFAYWGAYVRMGKKNIDNVEANKIEEYSEYLFNAEFKAGVYGPYIEKLPKYENKYEPIHKEKKFIYCDIIKGLVKIQYNGELFKFLDHLLRDLFKANEFDLMDISMKDEEYQRAKDNNYGIMDNDKIIDEYCKTKF